MIVARQCSDAVVKSQVVSLPVSGSRCVGNNYCASSQWEVIVSEFEHWFYIKNKETGAYLCGSGDHQPAESVISGSIEVATPWDIRSAGFGGTYSYAIQDA